MNQLERMLIKRHRWLVFQARRPSDCLPRSSVGIINERATPFCAGGRPHPERDTKQRHQFRYGSAMWEPWLHDTYVLRENVMIPRCLSPGSRSQADGGASGLRTFVPPSRKVHRANNHLTRGAWRSRTIGLLWNCTLPRGSRRVQVYGGGASVTRSLLGGAIDARPVATGLGYRLQPWSPRRKAEALYSK